MELDACIEDKSLLYFLPELQDYEDTLDVSSLELLTNGDIDFSVFFTVLEESTENTAIEEKSCQSTDSTVEKVDTAEAPENVQSPPPAVSGNPRRRLYKCKVCKKFVTRVDNFRRHLAAHSDIKPFKCFHCTAAFSAKVYLKRHLSETHLSERLYVCDSCGKAYRRLSHLKGHQMSHTGVKPHKCDYCGRAFLSTSNLKAHKMTHSPEKQQLLCNICGKSYSPTYLKNHMDTHKKISKPRVLSHDCIVCGKTFNKSFNAKRHLLSHAKEKAGACRICGKLYLARASLIRHENKHKQMQQKEMSTTVCKV